MLNKKLPKPTYNEDSKTSKTPRNIHGSIGLAIVMGNSSLRGADQLNSARVQSNHMPGILTPKPTSVKQLKVDFEQKMAYPTPDLRNKNKLEQKNNMIMASSKHHPNMKRYSLLVSRPEDKPQNQQRVLTEIMEETHENSSRRNDFLNCKSVDQTPVFREYKQSNNLKSSILSGLNQPDSPERSPNSH